MSASIGQLATKNKTTAIILFARTGTADYVPLGNVTKFSHAPSIQRYTHMQSQVGDAGAGGTKRADGKLVTTIEDLWKATLDEHTAANLRLLLLGAAQTATNQASNASLAVSISAVKLGFTYWVGAYNITSHALTFDGSSATEGTDFTLDKASGILTILSTGTLSDGDAVAGTISVPAQKYDTHTSADDLRASGAFQIFEFDQFSKAPRRHTTFTGEIYVSNWGEQTVDAPTEFEVEILAISKPSVKERVD